MNISFYGKILFICSAVALAISANKNHQNNFGHNLDYSEAHWVDSTYAALSPDERLGQLFILQAFSGRDAAYEQLIEDQVRRYNPAGLCFFQGSLERQVQLTNRYQAAVKTPMIISMDAEWGLGMRLPETCMSFPKQLALGAIADNKLIYEMGREIARQCKRIGVQLNFAPVADINNNPDNPVINDRSFGEDRLNVAAKAYQYMMGLQDGGVLACAKHFPGHGDTNIDSHEDLPVINHSAAHLDSVELLPFRVLAQQGIGSVMVSHLHVHAIDDRPNMPASLSERAVTQLLRKSIGYKGLVITDAMEMKGITKYFAAGEADVAALKAGNDLVLMPENIEKALIAVKKALESGVLDKVKIEESIKRVLRAKYRLQLTAPQKINEQNLSRDINSPEALQLKRKLFENAVTLVRDQNHLVPFEKLDTMKIATLALGTARKTVFQKFVGYYTPAAHFIAGKEIQPDSAALLLDTLSKYNTVLISLHSTRSKVALRYGLSQSQIDLIAQVNARTRVLLVVFGNPYSLQYFDAVPGVLLAFTEDENAQDIAAQALFGAIDIKGTMPVTASRAAKYGDGIAVTSAQHRMGYELPIAVGVSSDTLAQIDALCKEIIDQGAAPGCQVLVAKDGKIIWNKAYGFQTYGQSVPVTTETLFDIASMTKIAATTLMAMRETEVGHFDLNVPMATYLPELNGTDKQNLLVDEILAHHAGLQPWIPFYKKTVSTSGIPNSNIYRHVRDSSFSVPVTTDLFMSRQYMDTIWQEIFDSPLRSTKDYKYSDLGLFLTFRALQRTSGKSLDGYMASNFYRPLGLSLTCFNPWQLGLSSQCAPTEEDNYFRQKTLQGCVHDMGAAMMGGVCGHAGLFSTSNDLAKIFQMLLQKGSYFGYSYLKPETVQRFATRFRESTRRGIGFDMKELNPKATANMSALAGENTFGHMGFTGTCGWADPDKGLIFIFLSNRTYPSMENNKLINGDYRPRLQSIVYRALPRS